MQFQRLFDCLQAHGMSEWQVQLETQLHDYFANIKHGDYPKWQQALDDLPSITPSRIDLNQNAIVIGDEADIDDAQRQQLITLLKAFLPWRKGPVSLFGQQIDAEWQSNLKWDRFCDKIEPLHDRLVLDIGCGNGYYGWRMLGQGAKYVVGLEPTLLFFMQYLAFKQYLPEANFDIIPIAVQDLPDSTLNFDTVFSMGVIYHRRDPIEHLLQLKNCLSDGGQLVLETLIIESEESNVLEPKGRYAKMNNVWTIPNQDILLKWISNTGFKEAEIIDVSRTTTKEQRVTDWMQFESLADFLDPEDPNKTIEGHPAPIRAIVIANK